MKTLPLQAVRFVASVICVVAQDDFIGDYKYAAFNNITTINFAESFNFTTIISPSLIKNINNPLFGQDKPWEANIENGYPNVIYDANAVNKNKTFQLWYDDFIQDSNPRIEATLYASSTDGIHWTKPNLNIIQWNDNTNNNIVFENCSGVGVFKDRYTKNKNELYKAFGILSKNVSGTATSPDGIHWLNYRNLSIQNRWDCHNNMFFDINASNEYIGTTRGLQFPPRTIAKTNSNGSDFDMSNFSDIKVVESTGNDNQTYSQITFKYYNIYLGIVMIYASNTNTERVFCELTFSVDLNKWYQINRNQQFIPLSDINSKQFDSYICFAAAFPIIYNDTILLYYVGSDGPHSDLSKRNSSFGLATIRLDGFAGITNINRNKVAVIQTYQLMVNGKYFIVNIDSINSGIAKVGFKNVNGFNVNDCDVIQSNVTDYVVSWKGNKELNGLFGTNIIIQFELNNSILYTFGFVNSTDEVYQNNLS
eukprot:267824_1